MRDLSDEVLSRQCCWPRCNRVLPEPDIPICRHHAIKIFLRYREEFGDSVASVLGERLDKREQRRDPTAFGHAKRRDEALVAQSQVYYVRIGDHIKIGYTVNLRTRCSQLRVDVSRVMATEPGGRKLEQERHQQFAAERVGRREDFNPSPRLLEHIERVTHNHGPPRITTYPHVA